MSEGVYTGLYANEEAIEEVAYALIRRLLIRCRLTKATPPGIYIACC